MGKWLGVLLVLGVAIVACLAAVPGAETSETCEGGEELIVSVGAARGHEGSHGEGVHEGVVELLRGRV